MMADHDRGPVNVFRMDVETGAIYGSTMKTLLILLAATVAMPAFAQTQNASDVVVMRRTLAPARQAPAAAAKWSYGDWSYETTNACTPSARQTRSATCTADGATVASSRCAGLVPETTSRTVARTDGCTGPAWTTNPVGGLNPACTPARTYGRSVVCAGVDASGASVAFPDEQCDGEKPSASVTTAETTSGCASVAWTAGLRGPWTPSECSASATYVVDTDCRAHMAAGDAGFPVSPDKCMAADKPTAPAASVITSGCTGIDWKATPIGPYSSTCSASATRSQTVACTATASNGTSFTLPDARCNAATRPGTTTAATTVYSGCAAKWSATAWTNVATTPQCSASVQQTRTSICVATVGGKTTTIPDENCTALGAGAGTVTTQLTRTTSDYTGCAGTWTVGTTYTYGSCTAGVRNKDRDDVCRNATTGQVYADGSQCNPNSHTSGFRTQVGCLGTCSTTFRQDYGTISGTQDTAGTNVLYLGGLTGSAAYAAARSACEDVKINGQYKYLVACEIQGDFVYATLSNAYSRTLANTSTVGTVKGKSLSVCTAYP